MCFVCIFVCVCVRATRSLQLFPYVFGWVIVGNVCFGSAHKPSKVDVFRTNILHNGRPSFCEPCPNQIRVKEKLSNKDHAVSSHLYSTTCPEDLLGNDIFKRTQDDDKAAPSIED